MIWPFAPLWDAAPTFEAFVAASQAHGELWASVHRTARVPDALVAQAAALGAGFRLVAIVEDWCGDAANTVPVIAALVERLAGVELRLVRRDAHPELMDRYLTGTSRSIPIVIVLTDTLEELGHWGPRPAELQAWVMEKKRAGAGREIYPEVRRWYAHDKGESTLREVLRLMAARQRPPYTP